MSTNPEFNAAPENNECSARGTCSLSPAISSLQELVLVFTEHTAYYILKLEEQGASNDNIKYEILKTLSALISVNEFSENQLFELTKNSYFLMQDTLGNYRYLCRTQNIISKELKHIKGFDAETQISEAISLGDKILRNRYQKISQDIKNFREILFILLKSVCLNLTKIIDFNEFDNKSYHEVLSILNIFNSATISTELLKEKIAQLAEIDHKLQLKINKLLLTHFNGIQKVNVSHSTRKGKALLVSGNDYFDLLNILEETKNDDLDIYTHSNLLIVHALSKFRQYPNLHGHYGDSTENCILDFATFPGAILLTKNFRNNREYFYRGRLFSTDYIIPNGVIKVTDNNFKPLIETAKYAKGFSKGRIKEDTELGYDETELKETLNSIAAKLKNGEIKRLYIIGNNAHSTALEIYFKKFFKLLRDDEFVISFSYSSKKDNVLTINAGDYMPLVSGILYEFTKICPLTSDNIIFMFTTCDVMTISSIVLLKNNGAKNLYMAQCTPTIINPSVLETYKKEYSINFTTEPQTDLENIRKNKSSQ